MSDNKISYYKACAQALGPIGSLLEDLPDKFPVEILQLIRCYVDEWTTYKGRPYFCGFVSEDVDDGNVIYLRDPATGCVIFGGLFDGETIPRVLTEEAFEPVCWVNVALRQAGYYISDREVIRDHDKYLTLSSMTMVLPDADSNSPPKMYIRNEYWVSYAHVTDHTIEMHGFFIDTKDDMLCVGSHLSWCGQRFDINPKSKTVAMRIWKGTTEPRSSTGAEVHLVDGGADLKNDVDDAPQNLICVHKSPEGKWVHFLGGDVESAIDANFTGLSRAMMRSIWRMVHRIFTGDNYQKILAYFRGRLGADPSDLLEEEQLYFPKLERVLLSVIA